MAMCNANQNPYFIYAASFASSTTMAANSPQTIIAPAANANGMIVWDAGFQDAQSAGGNPAILAKTSAPANVTDGDVIVQGDAGTTGATNMIFGSLKRPVRIPAGKGLYYIQNGTTTAPMTGRHVLYTLL